MPHTVLIVDDAKEIREFVRTCLIEWGFKTHEALNGRMALEIIERERPNLVILDHHMPEMEGLTVLTKLRKQKNDIPVIMLTGNLTQQVAIQGFRNGANDFLSKPFDPDYLEIVIERVLHNHQNAQNACLAEGAQEASRLKSEFLANMSHELRSPLHSILGLAETLLEGLETNLPQKTLRLVPRLQHIQESARAQHGLITDLLDLAKLEAGKMDFSFSLSSPWTILQKIQAELSELASSKSLVLKTQMAQQEIEAQFDQKRITQLMRNLVTNAIKFTEKGVITLSAGERAFPNGHKGLFFSVTDQGIGIPEGEAEQVFKKFVQSSRTNNGSGGTGLGLSICQEIALRHGGEIKAHNNPSGQGATFTVLIPKHQPKL